MVKALTPLDRITYIKMYKNNTRSMLFRRKAKRSIVTRCSLTVTVQGYIIKTSVSEKGPSSACEKMGVTAIKSGSKKGIKQGKKRANNEKTNESTRVGFTRFGKLRLKRFGSYALLPCGWLLPDLQVQIKHSDRLCDCTFVR